MKKDLVTAGEFAKLACTTKRTVLFYGEKGILKPSFVDHAGYRYYQERQILDYQVILLLRTLNIPLSEIKIYLDKNKSLKDLFVANKNLIQKEIRQLQFALRSIGKFFANLEQNKTMVNPVVKQVKSFEIFYINKLGSYAKIGDYCRQLKEMFAKFGKNFTTLTIFEDEGYRPKKSQMRIAALVQDGMMVKKKFKEVVKKTRIEGYKALSYTHNGSGSTLSLFWKELEKYRDSRGYKKTSQPTLEFYHKVSNEETKQFFEIQMPIK